MALYIFLFVVVTIPLLFVVCVIGGGMIGNYVGQQMVSFRRYASSYPGHGISRHTIAMDWGSRVGSLLGWFIAVALVLAFYFFGSIR